VRVPRDSAAAVGKRRPYERPAAQPLLAPPASSCRGRPLLLAGGPARSLVLSRTELPAPRPTQTHRDRSARGSARHREAGELVGPAVVRPALQAATHGGSLELVGGLEQRLLARARSLFHVGQEGGPSSLTSDSKAATCTHRDPLWTICGVLAPCTPRPNAPLAKITRTRDGWRTDGYLSRSKGVARAGSAPCPPCATRLRTPRLRRTRPRPARATPASAGRPPRLPMSCGD
jgi:hypothetical protein